MFYNLQQCFDRLECELANVCCKALNCLAGILAEYLTYVQGNYTNTLLRKFSQNLKKIIVENLQLYM